MAINNELLARGGACETGPGQLVRAAGYSAVRRIAFRVALPAQVGFVRPAGCAMQ